MEHAPKFEKPEEENNVEDLEEWKVRREAAPSEAREVLENKGLVADLEAADPAEVAELVAQLPGIISELSFDENGKEINSNRYVVKALSIHYEKARRLRESQDIETPLVG